MSSYLSPRSLFTSSFSSGGGGGLSYQDRARALLSTARQGGGGAMALEVSSKSLLKEGASTGVAGIGVGLLDNTIGASFEKYCHGVCKPSTALLGFSILARFFNVDKNKTLRAANTTYIKAMMPILGVRLGERLARGSLMAAVTKKVTSSAPVKKAGIAGASVEGPIPGERTTA